MRRYPKISSAHSGPYELIGICQDPGTLYGAGCDAQNTGAIGATNNDQTAKRIAWALRETGRNFSTYLPANAYPWYDRSGFKAADLQEGASYNSDLIKEHGIKLVLLMGKQAQRSREYLDVPQDVEFRELPHPGQQAINRHPRGRAEALKLFLDGFRI